MLSTMSSSTAPLSIACSASVTLVAVVLAPCGNPTVLPTRTSVSGQQARGERDIAGTAADRSHIVVRGKLQALFDLSFGQFRFEQGVIDRFGDLPVGVPLNACRRSYRD